MVHRLCPGNGGGPSNFVDTFLLPGSPNSRRNGVGYEDTSENQEETSSDSMSHDVTTSLPQAPGHGYVSAEHKRKERFSSN